MPVTISADGVSGELTATTDSPHVLKLRGVVAVAFEALVEYADIGGSDWFEISTDAEVDGVSLKMGRKIRDIQILGGYKYRVTVSGYLGSSDVELDIKEMVAVTDDRIEAAVLAAVSDARLEAAALAAVSDARLEAAALAGVSDARIEAAALAAVSDARLVAAALAGVSDERLQDAASAAIDERKVIVEDTNYQWTNIGSGDIDVVSIGQP